MADMTTKANQELNPKEQGNLSDVPIEDTDLVSDTPVDDEDTEEPVISNLPQEVTESYGTGVPLDPGLNIGGRTTHDKA
ncbi:MAG: hypothetical protein RIB93_07700 [Coleofasciculus sp. D1-CHI-01]|uniref:hypothetical protein n=1 Tax=Coleofasciculus sp. D1-CHI-01 TaxID=3068482 RepID=UPI0032F54069